jgi:DNA-binding transcriptional regulator GbsR (MarR family)
MPIKIQDAKKQFIASWGAFGSHWGISKTMAQVHAHLLLCATPQSADDIMRDIKISRGNVNMNVRELIDWGLVERQTIVGERKEFFEAEKDIWKVVKQIMKERKKRELEPMLALMKNLQDVSSDKTTAEYKTYKKTVDGIIKFSEQADKTFERIIKADESWFWSNFLKLVK